MTLNYIQKIHERNRGNTRKFATSLGTGGLGPVAQPRWPNLATGQWYDRHLPRRTPCWPLSRSEEEVYGLNQPPLPHLRGKDLKKHTIHTHKTQPLGPRGRLPTIQSPDIIHKHIPSLSGRGAASRLLSQKKQYTHTNPASRAEGQTPGCLANPYRYITQCVCRIPFSFLIRSHLFLFIFTFDVLFPLTVFSFGTAKLRCAWNSKGKISSRACEFHLSSP